MSGLDIDVSDVLRFADDLQDAAAGIVEAVKPVVAKGALNIKQAQAADFDGSKHFRQVGRTISYDVRATGSAVEATIGPRTGGAGSLANIAYFGGAHGGGGSVRDPLDAALEEQPRFEAAISAAIGDLLR